MSNENGLAIISIKLLRDVQFSFGSFPLQWQEIIERGVTTFDFDNHSEPFMVDLALKLTEESNHILINVDAREDVDDLNVVNRFFSSAIRKFKLKIRVVYQGNAEKLAPYFKVLKADEYQDELALKALVTNWVNEY